MNNMQSSDNKRPWPPVRRVKQQPKWKRILRKYWPPIRFSLLILAALTILSLCVGCIVKIADRPTSPNSNGTHGQTGSTENGIQSTTTPPTLSQEEIQAQADVLIKDAEFIAAGYDYQSAISLLESFEYYDRIPELSSKVSEYKALDSQLVSYPNMSQITHIFFHSLIVDTKRAFDGEYTDDGYNLYMTTVDEFNAILQQMYDRGFVLVSPYDIAYEITDENGTHFTYGDIRLPEGKIPFLMSQDDVNYYGYMISDGDGSGDVPAEATADGDGFACRLVIGEDGYPTCEYIDENGNLTTGDYDLVPLLEKFIQAHPDFSYHGARAILGVTGYEGVLGYRTKPAYEAAMGTEAYQKELEDARAVVKCLKDHGWILASHSYGHPAYGSISAERVEADTAKWENTCQPVIGDTDVILYPHGSDIAGIEKYSFNNAKFKSLYDDGYRYFFNVDSHIYWSQLGENYFRGGRRNLDGYRMYHDPEMLDDLFDVATVFDKNRPTPVPSI